LIRHVDRLIVDGYNVIHAWPPLKRLLGVSLEAARDKLVERLSVYGLVTETDVTVVFDAHHSSAMANAEQDVEGVHVVFTRKGHSADHVIERLAYTATGGGDNLTVATSDRFQSDLVRGMGGAVISAPELERQVIAAEEELGRRLERYQ
jgi:predicted RNA-binding protein with PIN domain